MGLCMQVYRAVAQHFLLPFYVLYQLYTSFSLSHTHRQTDTHFRVQTHTQVVLGAAHSRNCAWGRVRPSEGVKSLKQDKRMLRNNQSRLSLLPVESASPWSHVVIKNRQDRYWEGSHYREKDNQHSNAITEFKFYSQHGKGNFGYIYWILNYRR